MHYATKNHTNSLVNVRDNKIYAFPDKISNEYSKSEQCSNDFLCENYLFLHFQYLNVSSDFLKVKFNHSVMVRCRIK